MKKIEWNKKQRKAFQDLLREFVALIDVKAQEEKQTGKIPKIPKYGSCQKGLNKFLAPWGYACKISLGSGNLSHEPSIAFCRQDILGEGFVNRKKPTPKKGFFLWFAYYWCNDAEKFYLCIGRSIEEDGEKECQKCLAYDKIIDPNGNAYYQEIYDDLEAHLEKIANDFLRFANEFNQIPTACFELEPSSASH
ncbi:hypothetical protein JP0558_03520 [Helicobacter pylori]|uniref:hypothetical protein n=1 Tax=Helicobacter pylori TaxID=210 RepID=UPI0009588094|nr:hypothetical protein [Helicobacter pylori]PUD14911.1 hypothetical protein C2R79_02020 [Helicobacter pylori]BAW55722.1 uncharacterized protein HPF55_0132 [Helicobacter pylori]BBK69111.1 hypothetical protein DO80_01670 [Helicobacter pylori]BCI99285.1 hypothetical protein JSHR3_02780 [Helicobacter pylori]GHP71545.1 hypothetical protein JP0048_06110 [Helicobacter pylori]